MLIMVLFLIENICTLIELLKWLNIFNNPIYNPFNMTYLIEENNNNNNNNSYDQLNTLFIIIYIYIYIYIFFL